MKTKVVARLFVKKEFIESFKELAATIIEHTRKETGCLLYSLFQDASSPGEFLFYEEYVNQEALDIHRNSEYLKHFRAKTGICCRKTRSSRFFNYLVLAHQHPAAYTLVQLMHSPISLR
ncbi:MAG: putative quinol monooxygenase [Candidatus Omnitrophota bacterium]